MTELTDSVEAMDTADDGAKAEDGANGVNASNGAEGGDDGANATGADAAADPFTGGGRVCIAGAVFEDRNALWSHVQAVQRRAEEAEEGYATGADAHFLFALLGCHPAANEKMAPGARGLGYAVNADFPDTKSFFVARTDGTRCGFSARKCVDELFPSHGESKGVLVHARENAGASATPIARPDAPPRPSRSSLGAPGCCVEVSGLEGQAVGMYELREVMNKYATTKFVDVNDDDGTAIVRFETPDGAAKACAECTEVNGAECALAKLEGDREIAYKKRSDEQARRRAANRGDRDGKGGGRGRGRGFGGGRGSTPIRRHH